MWGGIAGILSFLGQLLGFISKKDDQANQEKVIENKEAHEDIKRQEDFEDTVEKAQKTGDLDEVRKIVSE